MRIGLMGCEHVHSGGYAELLKHTPGVEWAGCYDGGRELGQVFASKHNSAFFESRDAFLEAVDAVVICSANVRHVGMALAAAGAKKHILVEKPIATTLEDAQKMIGACAENRVKLMVAFPTRYNPSVIRAKEIIDSGDLGEVVAIAGTNHGKMPGGWFTSKELAGGGSVMDHTVHLADLMHWMLKSDIRDVFCRMGTKIYDIEVEDCGLISLEFANGTYATIDCSWNRPEAMPAWGDLTMQIIGTKGTIDLDALKQRGMLYSNNERYSRYVPWGSDSDELMIRDFVRCIAEDLPSPITGEDGLFALKVTLMAFESAAKRAVVNA